MGRIPRQEGLDRQERQEGLSRCEPDNRCNCDDETLGLEGQER